MRIFTSFIAAGALTLATTTAQAGGLAPEIMERPDVQEDKMAPAGSSIDPTYVILGIVAALLIASAINANDGDDDDEEEAAPAAAVAEPPTPEPEPVVEEVREELREYDVE